MGSKSIGAAVLLAAATAAFGQSTTNSDPTLKLLAYSSKLSNPTGAVLLDSHYALVSQKNDGKVLLLKDGKTVATALDLKVANRGTQGLLDIALSQKFSTDHKLYLYYTPSTKDGGQSTSEVLSTFAWNKKLNKLSFVNTNSTIKKAKSDTAVDGMIVFNSKGKPSVAPGLNLITSELFGSAGAVGPVQLVHPGKLTDSTIVGLLPSATLRKTGTASLVVSGGQLPANLAYVGGTGAGRLQLKPVTPTLTLNSGFVGTISTGTHFIQPITGGATLNFGGAVIDLSSNPNIGTLLVGSISQGSLSLGGGTLAGTTYGGSMMLDVGNSTSLKDPLPVLDLGGGTVIVKVIGGVSPANTGYKLVLPNNGTTVLQTGTLTGSDIPLRILNPSPALGSGTITVQSPVIEPAPITVSTPSDGSGSITSDGGVAGLVPQPTTDPGLGDLSSSTGTISAPTDLPPVELGDAGLGTVDLHQTVPLETPTPLVAPASLALNVVQTPEPSLFGLLGSLGAAGLLRRRRSGCRLA